jgi:hypothetical protein
MKIHRNVTLPKLCIKFRQQISCVEFWHRNLSLLLFVVVRPYKELYPSFRFNKLNAELEIFKIENDHFRIEMLRSAETLCHRGSRPGGSYKMNIDF